MVNRLQDVDTRCIDGDGMPWLPLEPHADMVSMKLLTADPASGELIMVLRAPPGMELPRHRTSGPTTVYTLQGRWKFREHEWVAGPGSLVVAPPQSCHTPQVLGDGTDDAIVLILATGDLLLLDEQDRVTRSENWRTAVQRYLDYCRTHDLPPRNVTARTCVDNSRRADRCSN